MNRMRRARRATPLLGALALFGALVAFGCTRRPAVMPRAPVLSLRPGPSGTAQLRDSLAAAADDWFRWVWPWQRRSAAHRMPLTLDQKLHPVLRRWLVDSVNTRQDLLVTFVDTIPMPSLAGMDSLARRTGIDLLRLRRNRAFRRDTLGYGALFGIEPLERFWITQTLLLRVPMQHLAAMASRPEVIYVRPRFAGEKPPTAGPNDVPGDDAAVARDQLGLGTYELLSLVPLVQFSPRPPLVRIALIDTGLRRNHEAFANPLGEIRCGDCITGGVDCHTEPGITANQDASPDGHGTSTADLLSGRFDDRHAGLAQMKLDSYRVYAERPSGPEVDPVATKRAFEAAIADGSGGPDVADRVILAEVATSEESWSDLAREADHAYDLGHQVLAAIGNTSDVPRVGAPANARKVIGVGGYLISTGRTFAGEALGPTRPDLRIKPDLQAPTNLEAAGNLSPDDFQTYTGTSGAVPSAGAMAALSAGLWRNFGKVLEPGLLNVLMILAGQKSYPFDNTPVSLTSADHPHGVGHIVGAAPFGTGGGSVFLLENETREIPLDWAHDPPTRIDAAIWWADSLADAPGELIHMHSRVEIAIVRSSDGAVLATSNHPTSVFQRCSAPGSDPGEWKLRITTHEMREQRTPEGSLVHGQKIYWAVQLVGP